MLLSIEDLLLATLEYLREYRTYAHIAASYGIAESNIYRGIKWVGSRFPVGTSEWSRMWKRGSSPALPASMCITVRPGFLLSSPARGAPLVWWISSSSKIRQ